jgi:hypothetical protein
VKTGAAFWLLIHTIPLVECTLINTEKKYAPSAWKGVAGFLVTAVGVAALVGFYVYFHSPR